MDCSQVPEIFLNITQEVAIHLKYAYESLMYYEQHSSNRSRPKVREQTEEFDQNDSLYSKSEAKSIAEISAKYLKIIVESDQDILFFIILECPQITVSI